MGVLSPPWNLFQNSSNTYFSTRYIKTRPIFIKFMYLHCSAYIRSFLCFNRQPEPNLFTIFCFCLGWLYLVVMSLWLRPTQVLNKPPQNSPVVFDLTSLSLSRPKIKFFCPYKRFNRDLNRNIFYLYLWILQIADTLKKLTLAKQAQRNFICILWGRFLEWCSRMQDVLNSKCLQENCKDRSTNVATHAWNTFLLHNKEE